MSIASEHLQILAPPGPAGIIPPLRTALQLRLAPLSLDADSPDTELFAQLPDGPHEESCRALLVQRYSWLPHWAARRYGGRGENPDDLRQIAFVGLLEAIARFDADRGIDFAHFARPTILGEIKRHFRDRRRWIRVPRRVQEIALDAREAAEQLGKDGGRTPAKAELAAHLGVSEHELDEAVLANQLFAPDCLDAPLNTDDPESATQLDLLGGEDAAYQRTIDLTTLRPLIAALPERDRTIISMTFGGGCTQAEIGRYLGVSQMHVSRLLSRVLTTLRTQMLAD